MQRPVLENAMPDIAEAKARPLLASRSSPLQNARSMQSSTRLIAPNAKEAVRWLDSKLIMDSTAWLSASIPAEAVAEGGAVMARAGSIMLRVGKRNWWLRAS